MQAAINQKHRQLTTPLFLCYNTCTSCTSISQTTQCTIVEQKKTKEQDTDQALICY